MRYVTRIILPYEVKVHETYKSSKVYSATLFPFTVGMIRKASAAIAS